MVKGCAAVFGGGGKVVKVAIEMSHVILGGGPEVGWVGRATFIPWAAISSLAEPTESPLWEEARIYLSISIWRRANLSFQAVQVWAEGTRQYRDGRSLGNEFSERRAEVAIAAIQSSVIGREARVDLFFASSNLLINSGTQGYSPHHRCMVANMETTSARLIPPLCVAIKLRRFLGSTQV